MTVFIIIVPIVIIIAFIVNYLSRDISLDEEDAPLLDEESDDEFEYQPPLPIHVHFPPNPSEERIESYYQSLSESVPQEKVEHSRQINTINMYVESHYELHLSLFGKGPTIDMINEAYEKLLNEHVNCIAKGASPTFNITDKKRAKDYLIAHFNEGK
jgi:hypothetical protein